MNTYIRNKYDLRILCCPLNREFGRMLLMLLNLADDISEHDAW